MVYRFFSPAPIAMLKWILWKKNFKAKPSTIKSLDRIHINWITVTFKCQLSLWAIIEPAYFSQRCHYYADFLIKYLPIRSSRNAFKFFSLKTKENDIFQALVQFILCLKVRLHKTLKECSTLAFYTILYYLWALYTVCLKF